MTAITKKSQIHLSGKYKPNLPPMKAVIFEVIFSLEARTNGSENKGAILENMAPLFLRASRGKEFESDPFIGGKLGYKGKSKISKMILVIFAFLFFPSIAVSQTEDTRNSLIGLNADHEFSTEKEIHAAIIKGNQLEEKLVTDIKAEFKTLSIPLEEPLEIPLPNVVASTVENQWKIKIATAEVQHQKGVWQQSLGAFDTTIDAAQEKIWKYHVQLPGTGLKSDEYGFEASTRVSLRKRNRIGTEFSAGAAIVEQYNPLFLLVSIPPYDRINNFTLFFNIDQPLLRNFIYNQDAANEISSILELKAIKCELIQRISDQIRMSVNSYWDLAAAIKIHEIRQDALQRLQNLAQSTIGLVEGGELAPSEINQQMAEIEKAKRQEIVAHQDVYTAFNRLLFAMGIVQVPFFTELPPVLLEEFPRVNKEKTLLLNQLVHVAVINRQDLAAAQYRIEETEVQLKSAENGILPELNVNLGGTILNNEINERARRYFGAVFAKNPERDLRAAVRISIPICNDNAIGEYKQRRADEARAVFKENELAESIRSSVATAVKNYESLLQEIAHADEEVDWYQKTLKAEKRRLEEGYSTLFVVIDFENRLSNAQIEQVLTYRNYAQNLVDLLFLTGTLVSYSCPCNQVYIADVHRIDHLFQ